MDSNEILDFENSVAEIVKKLDRLDMELAMNAEAIESMELTLLFIKAELEFEEERSNNDYWS